jgi:adenylate cyclase
VIRKQAPASLVTCRICEANLFTLRQLLPSLGLALKSASNRQMAADLLLAYLGADAGKRVLSGEIKRGSFETIHAVIWYFDLQGFTKLS